jgi:hypothetical protein
MRRWLRGDDPRVVWYGGRDLPQGPSIGPGLEFLRGSRQELLQSIEGGRAVLYHFWRPSW